MALAGYVVGMSDEDAASIQRAYDREKKSGLTAALLGFLFGGVGAHRIYLGEMGLGVAYAIVSLSLIAFIALTTPVGWATWGLLWSPSSALLLTSLFGASGAGVSAWQVGWLLATGWSLYLLFDAAMMPDAVLTQNAKTAQRIRRSRRS